MGNMLFETENNFLLAEVSEDLALMKNCKSNVGNPNEVIVAQRRIKGLNVYVQPAQLKKIFIKTPLEHRESIVEYHFIYSKKEQKINILEVLASLITYSASTIDEKIQMAFNTFDFDGNQVITRDEMVMLCISFMRGIGIMTQSSLHHRKFSEELANGAFIEADTNPDGQITFEELSAWIKASQVLNTLLTRHLPKSPIIKTRKSILEVHGFELTKAAIGHAFENRFKVKVSSSPPKAHQRRVSEPPFSDSKKKLKKFFEVHKNAQGKVTLKSFFDNACKLIMSREAGNNLFNMMKGSLHKEVKFKELKEVIDKATEQSEKVVQEQNTEMLSTQELENLKELFVKYDLDSDGFLSLNELKKGLRDKFSIKTIESMFTHYDTDSDGLLSLSDFVKLYVPESKKIPDFLITLK